MSQNHEIDLTDPVKAEISLIMANADKKAIDGCDEEITLLAACCSIVKVLLSVCFNETGR